MGTRLFEVPGCARRVLHVYHVSHILMLKTFRMHEMLLSFLHQNNNQGGKLDGTNSLNTFCGIPHNLYLPRSKEGSGQKFELLAFVNDVSQDVNEGSDGIEHM